MAQSEGDLETERRGDYETWRDLPAFARLNDVVGQGKPGRVWEEKGEVKIKVES